MIFTLPTLFLFLIFSTLTLLPKLFHDNHGSEVDIWGVGFLILESRSFAFDISNKLFELGKWMQMEEPTTQEAFDIVMKYTNDFE
jgi:hypothetical protein